MIYVASTSAMRIVDSVCGHRFAAWAFSVGTKRWKEIGVNSPSARCKVLCQGYNRHIASVRASPSAPRKKTPTLLCTNPRLLQCAINSDITP